jgi:hypothetical protein
MCMTEGMISLSRSIGTLDGTSCSMEASSDRESIADLRPVVTMGEESEQLKEETEFGEGWFGMGWFRDSKQNNDAGDNGEDSSEDSTMNNSEEVLSL